MHAAAPGVSNAFRENACGRVKCSAATRNGDPGRRSSVGAVNGAVNGAKAGGGAPPRASGAAHAAGAKDGDAVKKEAGGPKTHSLMSMLRECAQAQDGGDEGRRGEESDDTEGDDATKAKGDDNAQTKGSRERGRGDFGRRRGRERRRRFGRRTRRGAKTEKETRGDD